MLGFDATGKLALGQIPEPSAAPLNQFDKWPPAPKPPYFPRDFIAFAGNPHAGQFPSVNVFSRFDPPAKPRNFSKDWIAFAGNLVVEEFPPILGFMPFSPGRTAKFWGTGQPPPWWPYYFQARFFPKRDRHDGGHWLKRRHPPVYSDEYYDRLRRREEKEEAGAPKPKKVRNLLIPLRGLIEPVDLPSLQLSPPPPFVYSLAMNPPPFRMATPEEMAMDDEMIIRMLLEE